MARQPDRPIPFRPRGLGRKYTKTPPNLIIDDRRAWFSSLSGLNHSNEIVVPATGYWPNVIIDPGQPVTEVLRVLLPRPEPVTLSFHPWSTTYAGRRFRRKAHLFAEVEPSGDAAANAKNARIIVEWGTGQSRAWTYFDAGDGSLHLPSVSDVRVSAWTWSTPFVLSANAQIGYSHSNAYATWTFVQYGGNGLLKTSKELPNFGVSITGYLGVDQNYLAPTLNTEATIELKDTNNNIMQRWLMRPAAIPNPQTIPYGPNDVPLSPGCRLVTHDLAVSQSATENITSVVRVKV